MNHRLAQILQQYVAGVTRILQESSIVRNTEKLEAVATILAFVVIPITVLFIVKWAWTRFGEKSRRSQHQIDAERSWADGLTRVAEALEAASEDPESESEEFVAPATPVSTRSTRKSAKRNLSPSLKSKTPLKTPKRKSAALAKTPTPALESESVISPAVTRSARKTRSTRKSTTSENSAPREMSPVVESSKPKRGGSKKSTSTKKSTATKKSTSAKKVPKELQDLLENQEQFGMPTTPASRRHSLRLRKSVL